MLLFDHVIQPLSEIIGLVHGPTAYAILGLIVPGCSLIHGHVLYVTHPDLLSLACPIECPRCFLVDPEAPLH